MTTSHQMELLSEILEWKPIPEETLVYFRERLRRRLHSAILDAFSRRSKEKDLTQKDFAARIHKSRVQINRWLSTSSNLTLDSISDLMVGLGMDFDAFPFTPIEKTIVEKKHEKSDNKSSKQRSSIMALLGANVLLLPEEVEKQVELYRAVFQNQIPSSNIGATVIPATPAPVAGDMSHMSEKLQKEVRGPAKIFPFRQKRINQSMANVAA